MEISGFRFDDVDDAGTLLSFKHNSWNKKKKNFIKKKKKKKILKKKKKKKKFYKKKMSFSVIEIRTAKTITDGIQSDAD